jgi:hypothetical protein
MLKDIVVLGQNNLSSKGDSCKPKKFKVQMERCPRNQTLPEAILYPVA